MKRVIIYYIRHGRTEFNRDGVIQGGRVDSPLVPESMHLIEDTHRAFEEVPVTRAYSSPLGRARQTAELVLAGHNLNIEPLEELREFDFGTLDGRDSAQHSVKLQFCLGYLMQNFGFWGGERAATARTRVRNAFEHMYAEASDGDIVCAFAHGSLFRYVLQEFGSSPCMALESRRVRVPNVSVATLVATDSKIELIHYPTPGNKFTPTR